MNESIEQGILVAFQGMVIVFVVLFLLALFIIIFKFFDRKLYPLPKNKSNQDIKPNDVISPENGFALYFWTFLEHRLTQKINKRIGFLTWYMYLL